ncbi:MAG: EamA family transporter [Candidatus Dormibacteraeota bacterium]|nr:EamA family transporter [Candidatus Dormibacteraeota bacterium]
MSFAPGLAALSRLLGRRAVAVAMVILWLAFGSAFVAVKVGVTALPPFIFSGPRFLVAGTVLMAWSLWRGGRLDLSGPDVALAALSGAGIVLAGQGGASWATQYMAPGLVAVLMSTAPLWVAVLSRLLLGVRLAPVAVLGLTVGFAGVVFLAWPAGGVGGPRTLLPTVVSVVGALGWAGGSILASRARIGRRPLLLSALQMLIGGALQVGLGLATGEAGQVNLAHVQPALPAFAYLVAVPSLIGFPIFAWLLTVRPVHVVNAQAYVVPVVALLLGWLLLGEAVSLRTVLGALVTLVGVALIVLSAGRTVGPARAVEALEHGPETSDAGAHAA